MKALESLGIIGWGKIEPIILSALVRQLPILLIGNHGTNKTEAAEVLGKATYGKGINFVPYDTPLLCTDDLMGYPDPRSLAEGEVKFIGTQISIWGQEVCMFDEINRASPFTASKLMECVRTKKVMGMATELRQVFGGVNPPKNYDSQTMDLAMASRWVCVQVPDMEQLGSADMTKILDFALDTSTDENATEPVDRSTDQAFDLFKNDIAKARAMTWAGADLIQVRDAILKVAAVINQEQNINCSPRQAQNMVKLLVASRSLVKVGLLDKLDVQAEVELVLSCVPEAHGVTRKSVALNALGSKVRQHMAAIQMGEPLMNAASLDELIKMNVQDQSAWAMSAIAALGSTKDPQELERFFKCIKGKLSSKAISQGPFNALAAPLTEKYLEITPKHQLPPNIANLPIGFDHSGIPELVKELFAA